MFIPLPYSPLHVKPLSRDSSAQWQSYRIREVDHATGQSKGILYSTNNTPTTWFQIQHFQSMIAQAPTPAQFIYQPYHAKHAQFSGNLTPEDKNFLAWLFLDFHARLPNAYSRLSNNSHFADQEVANFVLPWTLNAILNATIEAQHSAFKLTLLHSEASLISQIYIDFKDNFNQCKEDIILYQTPYIQHSYINYAIKLLLNQGFIYSTDCQPSKYYVPLLPFKS